MKLFKRLTKRTSSLKLGTLVALIAMLGVTSCRGCGGETNETTSRLAITPSSYSLQGRSNRQVALTFKLATGETTPAELDKLKLVMKVSSTGTGTGKVTYELSGAPKGVEVGKEDDVQLASLLGNAELGEDAEKKAILTFEPDASMQDMTLICYAVDDNGDKESNGVRVEWKDTPVGGFALAIKGLDGSGNIESTNKFTVKVSKVGGLVGKGDLLNLAVHVGRNPNDASIKGVSSDEITFVEEDIKNGGYIEKELEVIPGKVETTFTLDLKDNGNSIGTRTAICKAAATSAYTLELDRTDIDDGATKVTVTVRKGGEELQTAELAKLQLAVNRKEGTVATIAGKHEVKDKLKFEGSLALAIATGDKKSASRELTIVPGADKKAAFDVKLFDEKGASSLEQTIKWSNGAALKITNAVYNADAKTVTVVITNTGKLALEANAANLAWDTMNKDITIDGNRKGINNIPEILAKGSTTVVLKKIVFNDILATSDLELKLTWDKLESEIVRFVELAGNKNVVEALQGKHEAEAARAKIGNLTFNTAQAFADALVEVGKAKAGWDKAVVAQTALANDSVDGYVTDAKTAYDATQKAYEETVALKVKEATAGKDKAVAALAAVNTILSSKLLGRFITAADEIKKAEAGLKEAQEAQVVLGGMTKDTTVDKAVTDATTAVNDAKSALDLVVKPLKEKWLKGATNGKDKAVAALKMVNAALAKGSFMGIKGELLKAEAGLKEAQDIRENLRKIVSAGDTAIDEAVAEASKVVNDVKSALGKAFTDHMDKAKAYLKDVNVALGSDPKVFRKAKNAFWGAEGSLKEAQDALEEFVTKDATVVNEVTNTAKAIDEAKSVFSEALEAEVTNHMNEAMRERNKAINASSLTEVRAGAEAAKAAAERALTLAKLVLVFNENVKTRSIVAKDRANGAIRRYNHFQPDSNLRLKLIPD